MKFSEFVSTKKHIKIGYLGGSITEGGNASCEALCYRELVTAGLNAKYQGTTFETVHASIGGTGSDLGVFRMDADMMYADPDMVIIEFAVNDSGLKNAAFYIESIVRKILTKNPETKIVFIYTATQTIAEQSYDLGYLPVSVIRQSSVAKYYGIPEVNVGKKLYDIAKSEGKLFKDYTVDSVHPNDAGFKIYADHILDVIDGLEFNITLREAPIHGELPSAGAIALYGINADGWESKETWLFRKVSKGYAYADKPGTKLTLEFEGTIFGMYFIMGKDSGIFDYVIDGKIKGSCDTWDKYCLQFTRSCYKILQENLNPGKHTVEITVTEKHSEQSEGTYIKLGAILRG